MGLNDFFELWKNFVESLGTNKEQILKNPMIWIGIAVVVIGLFAFYDVPDRTDKNSLGNVVRQLTQALLDASGDMINAIRSITGFIGVVKLLLFGEIGPKTQFVLNNYAIIFLSMASFYTTFRGLSRLLGYPVAALVSFGVQVSILVLVTYIVILLSKEKKDLVWRRFYFKDREQFEKVGIMKRVFLGDGKKEEKKNSESDRKLRYILSKIAISSILIAVSVMVSSSFSYLYMFEKLVMPGIALDDYTRSMGTISAVAEDYSADLKTYQIGLLNNLQTYVDSVPEILGFQDDSPLIRQGQLEADREEAERLQQIINELEEEIDNSTDDTQELEQQLREARQQRRNLEDTLNVEENTLKEDMNFQYKLMAAQAIQKLTPFFANPLYINNGEENTEQQMIQAFGDLSQAVALLANSNEYLTNERQSILNDSFNNYLELAKYYSQVGRNGLDLTAVNKASEDQASTLQKYNEIKNGTQEEYAGMSATDRLTNADSFLREEGSKVLYGLTEALNKMPELSSVQNAWQSGNMIIAPSKIGYLDQIYAMYRDNSGQVDIMERGFRKLFQFNDQNGLLARLAALLAVLFDTCIVYLTIYRGKKSYFSSLSDYRHMCGLFFLNTETDEQRQAYKHGQKLASALGVILGGFLFILYVGTGNQNSETSWAVDSISLLVFCIACAVICTIIYKIYRRIIPKENDWRDEQIYQTWKHIWEKNGFDEREIKKKLKSVETGKAEAVITLDTKNIQEMVDLLNREEIKREFLRFIYPEVITVLSNVHIMELYTILLARKENKKRVRKLYEEKKAVPCVKESVVRENGLIIEFNVLLSRNIISAVKLDEANSEQEEQYYVLPERFWGLLYDIVLIRISGNSVISFNLEEDLLDYGGDGYEDI